MKNLILSENEKNNILKQYYTKFNLNEQQPYSPDVMGDLGQGQKPAPTTTTATQPQAPTKNYTIQELQQLLDVAVDGKAGPNTLAAIEKALQSKGSLPPAVQGTQTPATQTPQKTTTGTQQQVNVGQSSYAFTPSALQLTNTTAGTPAGTPATGTPVGTQKQNPTGVDPND